MASIFCSRCKNCARMLSVLCKHQNLLRGGQGIHQAAVDVLLSEEKSDSHQATCTSKTPELQEKNKLRDSTTLASDEVPVNADLNRVKILKEDDSFADLSCAKPVPDFTQAQQEAAEQTLRIVYAERDDDFELQERAQHGLGYPKLAPPEVPSTCCGSGCPNCVWIDYADSLSKYYADGGKQAMEAIERDITDPNLKAYLLMEVRMR